MANIKVFIDPKKVNKNGYSAIYLQVCLMYKVLNFPTKVNVIPEKFDFELGRIKGAIKKVKDDNLIIERCLASLNEIFVRYRLQNIVLTPELLREEWKNPTRRIDFYAFFEETLKERKNEIADGTYRQHESSINKLKEFRPTLAFCEINDDLLESYRKWLKVTKKNDINTIHTALKNFKTYVNIAKRKKVIDSSPFDTFRNRKANSDRVFLLEKELELIWLLYKRNYLNDTDQKILRHFLFMCFTGLRISDLKVITPDNIVSDVLVYVPVKTQSMKRSNVKVPLNSYSRKLIADEKSKTNFLFNCISEQKMNLRIKEIVKVEKIYKDVSNHCARHTFATLWLYKTKDLVGLQKLLGHSDIKQTMIYVHTTDAMIADEMKVFDRILFLDKKSDNPLMAIA